MTVLQALAGDLISNFVITPPPCYDEPIIYRVIYLSAGKQRKANIIDFLADTCTIRGWKLISKMICTTKERQGKERQLSVLPGEGEGSLEHLRNLKRRLTSNELARLTKTDPEAITSDEDEFGDRREKRGAGCW